MQALIIGKAFGRHDVLVDADAMAGQEADASNAFMPGQAEHCSFAVPAVDPDR